MSQTQTVTCGHCGAGYPLAHEYLVLYGGQSTLCTQCKQPFLIPSPPTPGAGPPPVPVLAYSGPVYAPAAGVWRDGKHIVAVKGAALPGTCVKCNAPADGPPMRRTLYWHHPALYALIFAGILIYAIVALIVRQKGDISLCVCKKHRSRRNYAILIGWVGSLGGLTLIIYGANSNMAEVFIPLGIILFLGTLIGGIIGARLLSPTKIDTQYLWLRGAGPDFLNTLPDARGPATAGA
ncbi:MAG: hypothetical protein JWP03_3488 [Phycisphaerales bacterium]|nr:hypothetical protein [Phycisphaerales bacterium]